MIPDIEVKKFVGEVKGLHKVDAINVYEDRYRINVWTVEKAGLIDKYAIVDSYFVTYSNGKITNRTK
jgi:hypothetical protein